MDIAKIDIIYSEVIPRDTRMGRKVIGKDTENNGNFTCTCMKILFKALKTHG